MINGEKLEKILDVVNLSKKFGKKEVLKNISFSISENESIGFLGASGCGKTTLIRIIANLEREFSGKIKKKTDEIAVVFQEDRLIPWKTIRQNFEFISEDQKAIEEALKISDLKKYENFYPHQLSGGMRQRANFSRIVFGRSKLILLDEPFQSLDIKTKNHVISYFLKLKSKFEFSTILVSHDVKEEILLCDKIYIMSKNPATIIEEIKIQKPYKIDNLLDEFILKKELEILKSQYKK